MRATTSLALAATALTLAAQPGRAQTSPADLSAIAAQAEAAAVAADRAAASAAANSAAAAEAARAARTAADAALGKPAAAMPSAEATLDSRAVMEKAMIDKALMRESGHLTQSVANGTNDGFLKTGSVPDAQLLVSEEGAVASIAVSIDDGGEFIGNHIVTNSFVLKAFGNLKDGKSTIAGLGGFSKGAGISFSFTRYMTPFNLAPLRDITPAKLVAVMKACNADPAVTDKTLCDVNNPKINGAALLDKYDPAGAAARLDAMFTGHTVFFGADFLGSQSTYSYLDRTGFELKDVSRFGIAGSLFGGWIDKRGRWSFTGFASYERVDEENDPVTLCQPLPQSVQSQCLTGADGAPVRGETALVGMEWRQQFSFKKGGAPFAIAPRFAYDVKNSDYSFDVPVYFASDGEGKLRGGLRGVYQNSKLDDGSRKGSYSLSLFVGAPFNIFAK